MSGLNSKSCVPARGPPAEDLRPQTYARLCQISVPQPRAASITSELAVTTGNILVPFFYSPPPKKKTHSYSSLVFNFGIVRLLVYYFSKSFFFIFQFFLVGFFLFYSFRTEFIFSVLAGFRSQRWLRCPF